MIILNNFVYCLGTKTELPKAGDNPITSIIGLVNSLNPDFVPGNFSFSIVFSILNLDKDKEYKVEIAFVDEDENELLRTESAVLDGNTAEKNIYNVPNEYFGYNIAVELRNVILEKDGLYKTIIYIDGEKYGTYPVYVKGKRSGEK